MTRNEATTAVDVLTELESEPVQAEQSLAAVAQTNPYIGIAAAPFSSEASDILLGPIAHEEIEIRPDGLIYLPEIKYRRILNRAFGPGAWSLLPMEITVSQQDTMLYYRGALFVLGRFVSEAIGEQQYFPENDRMSYATAAESAKSNCLMRCCKDLGIASELWDPTFVRGWVVRNAVEVWCVNNGQRDKGKKRKMWRKKGAPPIDAFPWKEEVGQGAVQEPLFARDAPATTRAVSPARAASRPDRAVAVPQSPLAPVITIRQVGRFRAIARASGWNESESNRLLSKFGFDRPEQVTRDTYDRLCRALESTLMLAEVRAEIDEEMVYGSGE